MNPRPSGGTPHTTDTPAPARTGAESIPCGTGPATLPGASSRASRYRPATNAVPTIPKTVSPFDRRRGNILLPSNGNPL